MNNLFKILYRHRYDIICSIILVILFSLLFIIFPKDQTKSIINAIENKTFDIRQNLISKNKKADKDIIIVTVDDPSYEYLLEEYGDWPIPRDVYAQVLDYIQSQHPKFTAFDLLFIKSLNRVAQSDKKLISAFKKYKNTFTAINFDDYSFDLR